MRRRLIAALGLLFVFAGVVALPALAGTQPPPDDADPNDDLRALVPEGFPGEYDLTEADAEFGEFVSLFGESTDVADFGDGSALLGQCGGFAYSYDGNGNLLDAAADLGDSGPPIDLLDGGQAFTSGNPFKVDTDGVVLYYGFFPRSGDGPLDHRWNIKTAGISLDEGGDPNPNGKNRAVGLVDLADDLPVKFNAKVRIQGKMDTQNLGQCVGEGHVDFQASLLANPIALGGIAALAGGIFGLLFNARPAMTYKV